MNKEKATRILIIAVMTMLVLLVIVTSIVLHQKRKKLDDLNDKNEIVKPDQPPKDEESVSLEIEKNLIIIK